MLRGLAIVATMSALGCPSQAPPLEHPQPRRDDTALRLRIAHAEAKRAGGIDALVELATSGDVHARQLALRGLGRIGDAKALAVLTAAIGDRDPAIASAAFASLGVAASLDDTAPLQGLAKPPPTAWTAAQTAAMLEAFGRAGGLVDQRTLVALVAAHREPLLAESLAVALGRMGRRKITLGPEASEWLIASTRDPDRSVRYAATYALSREHEPRAGDAAAALAARITDDDPEIRATAIAGLVRRNALGAGRKDLEDSLRDRDWRVAVEAVRALAGDRSDDLGHVAVVKALGVRMTALEHGDDAEAHVVIEALQLLAKHEVHVPDLVPRAHLLASALTRGWIASSDGTDDPNLPDHLRLPLVTKKGQRAALRTLLEHRDARVRAAAFPLLAETWRDGDGADHRSTTGVFVAAFASPDPIVAGAAVDAAEALLDAVGDAPERAQLEAAIVARAGTERDVELAAALFELIGKRTMASGAEACRHGLDGHVVRARAAAACLKALGEAVPPPPIGGGEPPPVDVADVIGKRVEWHLATTRGEIVIALDPDVAPWNVATIVALTRRGFYDGLEVHRVVANFVVQGGDPTSSGWGGPGFTTPAEPATMMDGAGFVAGGVGIADAGRDSGGSQWFVMHSRAPHLDGRYTWIGQVAAGQKSADALLIGDKVEKATVWVNDRPR